MNLCERCGRKINSQHNRWCIYSKNQIEEVRKLYNDGLSSKKIIQLGFNPTLVCFSLRGQKRSLSESMKVAHGLYPDKFKHSEKTKQCLRKKINEFRKNYPEKDTRWSERQISYPEKLFKQLIEKNELFKKYDIVREFSIFPYFIDFAFIDIKLAVEIDGSQHWTEENRIQSDMKKDALLLSKNWKVYRIPAFLIMNQIDKVETDFLKYLQTILNQPNKKNYYNEIVEYVEFKKNEKVIQQKVKQKNKELKLRQQQEIFQKRKIDVEFLNYQKHYISKLSILWNVSHTQVRRFLLKYNLYKV